ncbi:MAG: MFS transporter [Actinomycetota bacterium]
MAGAAVAARRGTIREIGSVLRRNPAFARVYAAQVVSFCGDWFATVALLGLVNDLTHSATLQALIITLQALPFALISPVAGVVVDHFDRRALMIIADCARTGLALMLLAVHTRSTLWIAFACVAGISFLTAFFEPASSAAIPNLVREDDLAIANLLQGSTWGTMLAVGAALGGVVTALFGRSAAFIGDAASFGISAALLSTVVARFQAARDGQGIHVMRNIKEMLAFARENARVRALIVVKGGFGIGAGAIALIAVMATQVFDSRDTGIGILMSARGAGALTGPFIFRRIFGDSNRALFHAIAVAFATFGLGYVLVGLAPALWVAAIGVCIAHMGGGTQWAFSTIGLQRFTPDRIRGRIFSADYMLVELTSGISILVAGVLASAFGARGVAIAFASIQVLWAVLWSALTKRWWPARGER